MLVGRILSPPELSDWPVLTTELLIFPSLPLKSGTLTSQPIQPSYAISTHLAILLEEVPLVDGEVRLVRVRLPHLLLQLHLLQGAPLQHSPGLDILPDNVILQLVFLPLLSNTRTSSRRGAAGPSRARSSAPSCAGP